MRFQYASGRPALCALTPNTTSGTLPAGIYYFWLQGRNDVGYNLPGPVASISVNGSQGIALTIPEQAHVGSENWLEYAILINTTNDLTSSKILIVVRKDDISLPYTLPLTNPTHITAERQAAAFPTTNLINGLLITRTNDGLIYKYRSLFSVWERHYDGYNTGVIDDTTNLLLGCDTPLSLISPSRHVINYDYSMTGVEGKPRTYWLYNDLDTPVPIGRQLGITTTVQDTDLSSLFYGLFKIVFEGYFDTIEEEYITLRDGIAQFTYLAIEIDYSSDMENLVFERNLEFRQGFQFKVFPEFDVSELGFGLNLAPLDSTLNLVPFLIPTSGTPTDLGELLGDVIIGNDPNLRRIYPLPGLSAFADTGISIIDGRIAKNTVPSTVLNLQGEQDNLILAINSSGSVYPVSSLRGNERQRALVSTLAGISAATSFSSQIEGNPNPNITFTVIYPNEIRPSLQDVIASSTKGTFNASEIVLFVRKRASLDGAIIETRKAQGFAPTNTTSDEFSFLYEDANLYTDDIPSELFGLWTPANLVSSNLVVQKTAGTFYFDFAVSFNYTGNTVTNIDHSIANGSVYELSNNLAEIGEASANSIFWKAPINTRNGLSNVSAYLLTNKAIYPVVTAQSNLPALYMYQLENTQTVNGDTYLSVLNGAGRFVKISGGGGTTPSGGTANAITDVNGDVLTDAVNDPLTFL